MSFVFYLHGIQKHKVFDTNGYTKWCLVFTCRKCRGNLSYKFLYLFRHVCLAEKLTSYYVWQRTATTIYMERYMKNGRNKSSKSRYLKIEVGCNIIHHNIILRIWLLHSPWLPQNISLLNIINTRKNTPFSYSNKLEIQSVCKWYFCILECVKGSKRFCMMLTLSIA